ncbi:HPF/RaiA family ribosome-associated protein [Halobacteriovorax sp. JY17]|uniref:HPF/RaiA family ribosome-associated protein n=1 Tax=Halobacteriovorax sp. JY17 TaxID=2014617 RepID=UPI000C64DCAC|nr:HPF/RaiA family ribosome-associated protein [Halobacteriovorax sp. JY17]PIK13562.1 MAG: hypothetical protein CES88_15340 [Halobacteriovorax sp. JY17]
MNIIVSTDHNIEGSAELNTYIESSLSENFERFKGALTRIEVHISDKNGKKAGGSDKHCLLEARVANHQPIVVSHDAETVYKAIDTASDKLLRALDNMAGKMTNHTSPKDLYVEEPSELDEDDI